MKIIRKINILVKSSKRLLIVNEDLNAIEIILCPQCGEKMSDAPATAEILGASVREVYRLVEEGKIHFYENAEKIGFLCPKSVK